MNRKFNFYQKNPHLVGMSDSELVAQDYTLFNGVQEPKVTYDKFTQRKIQSVYFFEDLNGKLHVEVIKKQEHILDANNNLIGLKFTHNWIPEKGDWLVKTENKYFSQKKITEIEINQRKSIELFLVNEGKNSLNPVVPFIYSHILNYLSLSMLDWIKTGETDLIYEFIDNAPTEVNSKVWEIFNNTDGYPKSISDLLNLESTLINEETGLPYKIKEYIKLFIK